MPPRKGQRWKRSLFAKTPEILTCVLCPTQFERRTSRMKYCDGCRSKANYRTQEAWRQSNELHAKSTRRRYHRSYYAENSAEIKGRIKRYRKTEQGKEMQRKVGETQRRNHPIKVAARQMVRCALVCGVLKKQPCEVCGEVKVEAHHEDYSKPLEVNWLCNPHHRQADRDRRRRIKGG
jgi:hypothetical protein